EKKIRGDRLPAGWFIQDLGLRGKKIGGAQVSEKHANFIINTGQAKAEDFIILSSFLKQKVRDSFGVQLEEEVSQIGF
ncbi:MAG: UDP-N-acetylenolpyruvoylglucosamine reductase, partial [Candidatus Moraniibacteriota bacterium]